MRPTRRRSAFLIALALAACDESAPTAVETVREEPPPGGLSLVVPSLTSADLVVRPEPERRDEDGPARALGDPGNGPPPPNPYPYPARSEIHDAKTLVGFSTEGYAWAEGSHRYQGNKSTIVTTLQLDFQGQRIAEQTGQHEDYHPIIANFGLPTYLSIRVRIYTSQTCGLTAGARSMHEAWWEVLYEGQRAGRSGLSTQATSKSQPPCPPTPPPPPPGGGGNNGDVEEAQIGSNTCYFWIEYDLETGEVLDAHFLFCEPTVGG